MRSKICRTSGCLLVTALAATIGMTACWCSCETEEYDPCDYYECCSDEECQITDCPPEYTLCGQDHECRCMCIRADRKCFLDDLPCCPPTSCDVFTSTCTLSCQNDSDCASRTEIAYSGDLECMEGVCDFHHCTFQADCDGAKVCFRGDCVTAPECNDVDFCKVMPISAVTRQGTTIKFSSGAFTKDGALAPGASFTWASSNPNVAQVAGGLVTGGTDAGEAIIIAAMEGCGITCEATVKNHGAVALDRTRVLVVDDETGAPVIGATVQLGLEDPATTDENGLAEFDTAPSAANPADVTVSHSGYVYATLSRVTSNDILVPVERIHDPMMAGGINSGLDFGMIRCEVERVCDVLFGIGGTSFSPRLSKINLIAFIGQMVQTEVELGGSAEDVPLPASFVLCLNQTCFKENLFPRGDPGNRIAWSLGGKIDLSLLVAWLGQAVMDGNEVGVAAGILDLLPRFTNFRHALKTNVDVVPLPTVEDVDDLNGNGMKHDFVPDYENFTPLDMLLQVPMVESMTFEVPELRKGIYDTVLVVPGVIVPGAGLVPLGISAGMDATDPEERDGVIDDPIEVHASEVAGRIPDVNLQRVVLVMAFNVSSLSVDEHVPLTLSGRILLVDRLQGTYSIDPFMDTAQGFYHQADRQLTISDIPQDADCIEAIFEDENNSAWHFLSEARTGSFNLPPAPPEGDRAERVKLLTIKLKDNIEYQDLPAFNDTSLSNLLQHVEAFSITEIP